MGKVGLEPTTPGFYNRCAIQLRHFTPASFRCRSRNARAAGQRRGDPSSLRRGRLTHWLRPARVPNKKPRRPGSPGLVYSVWNSALTLEIPARGHRRTRWACRLRSWRRAAAVDCRHAWPRPSAQRARDTNVGSRRGRIASRVVSAVSSRGKLRTLSAHLFAAGARAPGRRCGNMPTQQRARQQKYSGFLDENRSQVCVDL